MLHLNSKTPSNIVKQTFSDLTMRVECENFEIKSTKIQMKYVEYRKKSH